MGEENDEPRPGFNWFVTHKGQGKYFDTEFNLNGQRREVVPGHYTHVVTDMAAEWLNRPRGERPWLLMLGHKAPHSFYFPEPKYEHAFDNARIIRPANADSYRAEQGKPAWLEKSYPTWHGLGGPLYGQKDYGKFVRAYLGCIALLDDSVGRIYQTLAETGQLDRTLESVV